MVAWAGQRGDDCEIEVITGHHKTFRGGGYIHYLDYTDGFFHRCLHMKSHHIYQRVHFKFLQFIACQLHYNKKWRKIVCVCIFSEYNVHD